MTGVIVFLAFLFGGIAVWAGVRLLKVNRKRPSRPSPRVIAQSPTDPWAALMMRQRDRNLLRPLRRKF